ncbi:hypothetical protein C2845_PM01G06780 [Panicum miliaceum]|uniref:F-box associated beta-propeller type 3 domain-containing protein n=1 Tax=Panicum miliaceum TaxID=4540 RepID=A0A3L6TR88_PANMI|nr:hypothetical protein C2845_PM01G06780 [Panicum miliaceum]
MATKKARKDEIEEAPPARNPSTTTRKRKRGSNSAAAAAASTSSICDDVLRRIFARLPVRTLVASMALSKHHRRMILSPEFRSLCCRLGPPLPAPHIAYIATAKISSSCGQRTRRRRAQRNNAPTRSLVGPRYIDKKYVNTCNGVMLFAGSRGCVLWNPCVANSDKEVAIPGWKKNNGDRVLGLGYGKRSQTYKLLVSRKCEGDSSSRRSHPEYPKDLLVYSLGDAAGSRCSYGWCCLADKKDKKIVVNSLYLDGIIYLLHVPKKMVFAFDVDNETVATINLPEKVHIHDDYLETYRLMEVSGHPCIETSQWECRTLWVLTENHQWEPKCVIERETDYHLEQDFDSCSITGAWDCGGVLVLHFYGGDPGRLYIVSPSARKKMIKATLPYNLSPELSEYAFCWGYKPTLVSPGSIIGELSQEEMSQGRTKDIFEPLKPLHDQEKRKGQEAALSTVCLMELLVVIMRRLPENTQQVAKMLRECL